MSQKISVRINNSEPLEYPIGVKIEDVLSQNLNETALLSIINGKYLELNKCLYEDSNIVPVTMKHPAGARTYARSLGFLLIIAAKKIMPGCRVTIEHSLNKALYCELHCDNELNKENIELLKKKMQQLVEENLKFEKIIMKKDDAIKIFENEGMPDKIRLLKFYEKEEIEIIKCDDVYDFFYAPLVPSTGYLKLFEIKQYKPGLLILYPNEENPNKILEFKDVPKLAKIFRETEEWARVLDVADVGALNEKVASGDIKDIVLVSEALHEKKLAYIADKIYENRDKVKIVLIAGPSSSGKTTFSKRLSIQLRILGFNPIPISLDDYFVNREETPIDESGEYDFESIHALDINLFNAHLSMLLEGQEIELPKFDFIKGKRLNSGKKLRLDNRTILVIEGIHGLNELLTNAISRESKFKIYISALTQLNIDDHNRIHTTDVRLLRRIVRDSKYRGKSAEDTIITWPKVRNGEENNIFPFQEEADVMFNSTLAYEMCVLKKYAKKQLDEIKVESPAYLEAYRLRAFLEFFKEANDDLEELIPKNSIIREFIGDSCFE
ncbi:Threonine--tRNA ligase 2 [Caloramator mitchellensis]|uniref:Threonine--tRNA ligase 2 n=1 Tax=Caloramator mitchellensis TaxID=908809 RepID=A0A0R3K6E2_CALMK|nr:nucleoside kinase [Caloramator mitchellensis]KRQ87983.1 Threonine--tRNA ligase 2 [Caloramator mitchellensis]